MKKKTFIIIGIICLMLLAVWAYLLFFHTKSEEGGLFADFGWFTNQEITPIEILPPVLNETPLVNVRGPRLRQLTTKPVAGYTELYSTSSEPYFVRYVEAGLGHIYEINMKTGEEARISNTTVPQALKAEFSPSGKHVAIQADVTARNIITAGAIENGEFSGTPLSTSVTDFTFADNGELYYSEVPPQGTDTIGKALNLTTGTTRELFTIPFRFAAIGWAKDGRTTHYTYTKPASRLMGYLYSINNGTIVREPITGNGLNVLANDAYTTFTIRQGENYVSYVRKNNSTTVYQAPIPITPEKCTFISAKSDALYCAAQDFYQLTYEFPENWYKGLINFNDKLWLVSLSESSASPFANPLTITGRELDLYQLSHSPSTLMLYFINKHDKTLWVYETI